MYEIVHITVYDWSAEQDIMNSTVRALVCQPPLSLYETDVSYCLWLFMNVAAGSSHHPSSYVNSESLSVYTDQTSSAVYYKLDTTLDNNTRNTLYIQKHGFEDFKSELRY